MRVLRSLLVACVLPLVTVGISDACGMKAAMVSGKFTKAGQFEIVSALDSKGNPLENLNGKVFPNVTTADDMTLATADYTDQVLYVVADLDFDRNAMHVSSYTACAQTAAACVESARAGAKLAGAPGCGSKAATANVSNASGCGSKAASVDAKVAGASNASGCGSKAATANVSNASGCGSKAASVDAKVAGASNASGCGSKAATANVSNASGCGSKAASVDAKVAGASNASGCGSKAATANVSNASGCGSKAASVDAKVAGASNASGCGSKAASVDAKVAGASCGSKAATANVSNASGCCPSAAKSAEPTAAPKSSDESAGMIVFSVSGMTCGSCVDKIQSAVAALAMDGVQSCTVSLENGQALIQTSGEVCTKTLQKAIVDAGFPADLRTDEEAPATM